MKSALLLICAFGMAYCAYDFRDEYRAGKFYPSLLISAIAWQVWFFAVLFFWRD